MEYTMSKHLSLSDRALIERCLVRNFTFNSIAKLLGRSSTTVSREIQKHRVFASRIGEGKNECLSYFGCLRVDLCGEARSVGCFSRCKTCKEFDCQALCGQFVSVHCKLLLKPPYVCTGCLSQKSCRKDHAYYSAHRAHAAYLGTLKESRKGLRLSPHKLEEIGNLISPLIMKGQSINHIFSTHADEIGCSERTIYKYIDCRAFDVRNIDLPKKVTYRQRKKQKVLTKLEYRCRKGRTYEDFNHFLGEHPGTSVVEMDTVKGKRCKGKVILTMIFRQNNFMLMFLMDDGKMKSVEAVFDKLTRLLGLSTFRKLFPVILTDNGVEFKNPDNLEYSINNCQRTRIFYCDPQASWQKPQVEKNHALLRRILPKGVSFDPLSQSDMNVVCCHINSVARELFGNKTPFQLLQGKDYEKLLDSLDLSPIAPDEVILKPALLKRK